jgi:hypothetical protein
VSKIVDEIQAVVDRLQQEGHTVATRLENALLDLKKHFTKDATVLGGEAAADVAKVEGDAKPVVEEAKADAKDLAAQAKADAQADMAAVLAEVAPTKK